jgi:ABC-type sugar transport system permease subunit
VTTKSTSPHDSRLALLLVTPALAVIAGIALVPIAATAWEALHQHDLRLPWLGRPFIGAGNFIEALGDARFREAVAHTVAFSAISVPLELSLGLALALLMHTVRRGRGLVRVAALLPWAIPTVVAALVWRLMFENVATAMRLDWFSDPLTAWIPIVVADVWKTTPFVAVLLLAGLQTIDPEVYDSARLDGASPMRQLLTITIPLLAPALVVAAAFRTLDALRIFDVPYVMTAGGPGTATEPLSMYAFAALMERLRFGYGSALSIALFALTFVVALASVRALSRATPVEPS